MLVKVNSKQIKIWTLIPADDSQSNYLVWREGGEVHHWPAPISVNREWVRGGRGKLLAHNDSYNWRTRSCTAHLYQPAIPAVSWQCLNWLWQLDLHCRILRFFFSMAEENSLLQLNRHLGETSPSGKTLFSAGSAATLAAYHYSNGKTRI